MERAASKKRVDIEVSPEVLRWAAIEAAKAGMSRRKYLMKCIEYVKNYYEERGDEVVEFVTRL